MRPYHAFLGSCYRTRRKSGVKGKYGLFVLTDPGSFNAGNCTRIADWLLRESKGFNATYENAQRRGLVQIGILVQFLRALDSYLVQHLK